MARDPLWDTEELCSHAPGVGPEELDAAAASRRVEAAPGAVTADGDGPDLLGSGIEAVDESAALSADPQPAPARAFQCDGASDGGMDGAATAGSLCTKRRPHICH